MPRSVRVDALDRRIVAALQRDGRRPFTSIGRELGISEAAVRQRVARLQAAGIMQVVAVADPMALGYQAIAMVAIEVDGRARKQVAEAVERLPEVSYLVLTAGSFDLLAEVVCEDNDHLLRLLSEDLAAIEVDGRARKQVAEAVERLPEVSYLVLTAGSFDILAEVVCQDNDHLLRLLSEDLAAIEGVRRTEAFMYLRLLKEAYTWSVAPEAATGVG